MPEVFKAAEILKTVAGIEENGILISRRGAMNRKVFAVFFSVLLLLGSLVSSKVFAHCDTMDGPVVKDAESALAKGDVTPVLKWIKKDAEPEVRSAFQMAVDERTKTPQNKEAADKKFFETLIRIHRAGEGADFTGLKPAGAVEPIVAEADKALESGSSAELTAKMTNHLTEGVKERFDRAVETRKHKDESVEAGREYVEAYVQYVHYVEGIHNAVAGKGGHNEEAEESGEAMPEHLH